MKKSRMQHRREREIGWRKDSKMGKPREIIIGRVHIRGEASLHPDIGPVFRFNALSPTCLSKYLVM
jgi:hypothetical protein